MNLNESIKQALEDADVKDAIKKQIDQVTESKANLRVKELLTEKTNELNEQCEEFKQHLEQENQKILESKINDLNEHCECYKQTLDEAFEQRCKEYESEYAKKLSDEVSKYTDEVVEEFLNKNRQMFITHRNEQKANAILEALSAVCAVAGVRAEQITEGVNYLNNKQSCINDQRVKNLKTQLRLAEDSNIDLEKKLKDQESVIQDKNDQIQDLKDDFDETERNYIDAQSETDSELKAEKQKTGALEETLREYVKKVKANESENNDLRSELSGEKQKASALEETLREYVKKVKANESEIQDTKDQVSQVQGELEDKENELKEAQELIRKLKGNIADLKESISGLKGEKQSLTESVSKLKKQNQNLNTENNKILKMGVISEMKQGMTLVEAKRFEKIAEGIPFEQSRQYFDKLEVLKNELMNNPKYKKLNEVTGESDSEDLDDFESQDNEESFENSRWDHLI